MKQISKENYVFTVNETTKDNINLDFQTWARNRELSEYLVNYLKKNDVNNKSRLITGSFTMQALMNTGDY